MREPIILCLQHGHYTLLQAEGEANGARQKMRDDWRKAAPTSEGIERGGMEKPDREDENYWLPSSPSVSDRDDGREGDYWLPSSSGASVNGSAPVSHGKVDSAPESRGKVSTTPGNLGSGSQEKQTQGRIGRLVPTTEVGMKIWWKCNLCRFVVHDSSTANTSCECVGGSFI